MRKRLNRVVADLATPPIPEVQGWAAAYGGAYGPMIQLSQAVPGYAPHPDLLAWTAEAAHNTDAAGYGLIEGEPELVEAYAGHVSELYASPIAPEEVQITAGCNQAFYVALMSIANRGDEVVLTNPNFFNHEATLRLQGLNVRMVECAAGNGFLPQPEDIAEAIGPKTAAVVLCSPNNPTGAVYPAELLREIYRMCANTQTWLVIDETYRDFLAPDAAAPHDLFAEPGWRDTFIQLYSFSKSFCIPGHRVGGLIAAPALVSETVKVMDNLQICAPRPAQLAVAKALPALAGWRADNAHEMQHRANAFRAVLEHLPRWKLRAIGAYFAYVEHPYAGVSAREVAKELAEVKGIVTLPGTYFGSGQEAYLRFAFANADVETIGFLRERL
ncbi:MAG: aminotransferase [Pseudomonadota bacterium]